MLQIQLYWQKNTLCKGMEEREVSFKDEGTQQHYELPAIHKYFCEILHEKC